MTNLSKLDTILSNLRNLLENLDIYSKYDKNIAILMIRKDLLKLELTIIEYNQKLSNFQNNIVEIIRRNPYISMNRISAAMGGANSRTIRRHLDGLLKKNIIKKMCTGREVTYCLFS